MAVPSSESTTELTTGVIEEASVVKIECENDDLVRKSPILGETKDELTQSLKTMPKAAFTLRLSSFKILPSSILFVLHTTILLILFICKKY